MTDVSLDRVRSALAARYAIERELGAGGMATVYLAKDLRHDRPVAIKVLRHEVAAALGPGRFLAEIKLTAKLQHPHILPLLDSGEADGSLFYVMPLVEGESLRDRLTRQKQLPIDEALEITAQVAAALDYAHQHHVIHRDIKPENILLSHGQAVLADFGIALAVQAAATERITGTGISVGTPHYMSPEQATGERELGPQSDIYSLGAVLYEMLVGDPPHTGSTWQAVIARMMTGRPLPIRAVRETVPPHLEAAVFKALARTPADRFASAEAFVKALAAPAGARARAQARPGTRGRMTGRAKVIAGGLAVLVAVSAWYALWTRGRGGGSPLFLTVVIGAPTISGSDSTLGAAFLSALSASLRDSRKVRLVGDNEIEGALAGMGRPADTRLVRSIALQVAFRTGAAAVILPALQRVGSTYLLTADVISPEGDVKSTPRASGSDDSHFIPAVDELGREIRRVLGESSGSLGASRSLVYALTPSLEALRLEARSQELIRMGRSQDASADLERAVAIDPTFAVAWTNLVGLRENFGADWVTPLEHAARLADHLPRERRLDIESEAAALLDRDFARAVELGRQEFAFPSVYLDPEDATAFGLYLIELGDLRGSVQLHDSLLALSAAPSPARPYWEANRALAAAQVGDTTSVNRYLFELRRRPFSDDLATFEVGALFAAHRWTEVSDRARIAAGRAVSPLTRQWLWTWIGLAEAVRGRPTASREAFSRATVEARATGIEEVLAGVQLAQADAELNVLAAPEHAAATLNPLLSSLKPVAGLSRRNRVQAVAMAAALCAQQFGSSKALPLCRRSGPVDSLRDRLEALEIAGWRNAQAHRFDDAIRIGRDPLLPRAGMPGLRVRAAAAYAFEQTARPDSAVAIYEPMRRGTFGFVVNARSAIAMRSYALRRLAALGGPAGERARTELDHDWADAEPEFRATVVAQVLGHQR